MTSPQLSPEQRAQADKIYKAAFKRGLVRALAFFLVVHLLVSVVVFLIFHAQANAGWLGGMVVILPMVARNYATAQVQKAGLSLDSTNTQFIPKTAQLFAGPPIVYKSQLLVTVGKVGLAFWTTMLAFFAGLQLFGYMHLSLAQTITGFGCFLIFWIPCAYCASAPTSFRLDKNGIYSFMNGFWPRRITWSAIEGVEVQRNFNYADVLISWVLTFRGTNNTKILTVSFADSEAFALSSTPKTRQQTEEIIALIEARFRGDS